MTKFKIGKIKKLFSKAGANFSKILENAADENIVNTAAATLEKASLALADFRVVFHKDFEEERNASQNSEMPLIDGCIRFFPGGNGITIFAAPNAQEALTKAKACNAINGAAPGFESPLVFIKPHPSVAFVDIVFPTPSKQQKADDLGIVQTQEAHERAAKVMVNSTVQTSPSSAPTKTKDASASIGPASDETPSEVLEENNRLWKSKLDNVVEQYKEKIEGLRKENDKTLASKIEDVKKAHDDAAKDLVDNNKTWQSQIDDINKRHEGEIKDLAEANVMWLSKIQDLKMDHEQDIENKGKSWMSKNEDVKKAYERKVQFLKKKSIISDADMEDLQKEYKHGIEGVIEQCNKTWTIKIDNLQKCHQKEVGTLKRQVSVLESKYYELDMAYDDLDDANEALLSRQNELLIQQNNNSETINALNLAVECKDHAIRSNLATTYEFQKENEILRKNAVTFKNQAVALGSQLKIHIQQLENAQATNLNMRDELSVSNARSSRLTERLLVARERRAEVVSIYRRCEKSWVKCSSRATELETIFSGDAAATARVLKDKDEQIENLEAQLRSRFICDQTLGQLYTVLCNLYNRCVTVSNERLHLGLVVLAHMLTLDQESEMRTMILGQAMNLYGTDAEGRCDEVTEAPLCDNCPDSFLRAAVPNTDVCEEEGEEEEDEDEEEEEEEDEGEEGDEEEDEGEEVKDEEVEKVEAANGDEDETEADEEADEDVGKGGDEEVIEGAAGEVDKQADEEVDEDVEVEEEPEQQEEADSTKVPQEATTSEASSSTAGIHGSEPEDKSSSPTHPAPIFTFAYSETNKTTISNPFSAPTFSNKETAPEALSFPAKFSVPDLGPTPDAATECTEEKSEPIAAKHPSHVVPKSSDPDLNPPLIEPAIPINPNGPSVASAAEKTKPSSPPATTKLPKQKATSPTAKTPPPVLPHAGPNTSSGSNKTKQRNQQRKRTKARRAAAAQQAGGELVV